MKVTMLCTQTELVDLADPSSGPKTFPDDTCGGTPPVGFSFVPATGFWPTYRMMTPYLNTHRDLSQVGP